MTYAVMQTGPEPPTGEQLMTAFQGVPGLAALDVSILGKDACGVLVKGLELDRASMMQSALAVQGVETEVVDDAALPELPPPGQLAKVEFTPEGLVIDDLIGRNVLLEWKNFLLIAAGQVPMTEFKREVTTKLVIKRRGRSAVPEMVVTTVTKEEQRNHLLLEIISRTDGLRFHVKADRPEARLLFGCLGERRVKHPTANLALFVRDLVTYAPAAFLNQGALELREGSQPLFFYPSQTAFTREITWLLWMISSGRARGWLTGGRD